LWDIYLILAVVELRLTWVKKKTVKTVFVRSALVITNMVGLSFNSSQFKSYWPKTD